MRSVREIIKPRSCCIDRAITIRRSGRKPGARVTNQCLRARHFGSWVDHFTDLKNMADCQEWKGQRPKNYNYVRMITQHEEKFFQPSLKGIIRFDLNIEHDEVYGKFVLTVCICSILYFAKKIFRLQKDSHCFSFHKKYN